MAIQPRPSGAKAQVILLGLLAPFDFAQRLSGLSSGGLMEKRKTRVPFPAFPQPRLRLL